MLRSMTAYGRGRSSRAIGSVAVEISSLNRKHLEIKISLPKELCHFEVDVRQWIMAHLGRGSVTLKVFAEWKEKPPGAPRLNRSYIEHLLSEASGVGLSKEQALNWAMRQEGILSESEDGNESELRLLIEEAIQIALKPFVEMKEREGVTLAHDLLKRINQLKVYLEEVSLALTGYIPKQQEKMKEFLAPYFQEEEELEERVIREVALLAKNSDYTEEVVRFRSHLEQFEQLISGAEFQVGKTIEFLLQEMGRETNTLGAKAGDLGVIKKVVQMKSELEKIREQIQNVE